LNLTPPSPTYPHPRPSPRAEASLPLRRSKPKGFTLWLTVKGWTPRGGDVDIYARVSDGTLDASQGVKAGNSATGRQSAVVDGYYAYAYCTANNPDKNYYAYVDNYIQGNAYFEFLGEAAVNAGEARAHQISYAEGDLIWPWAESTYELEEKLWAGTRSFESWAWTNANDYDQDIVEL